MTNDESPIDEARLTNLILEDDPQALPCPNCGTYNIVDLPDTITRCPMFATIACSNCSHEFLVA